ncbi:uncharacterized protein LOC144166357 isoform X2 [Haemaphysalis longicornis]
MIVGLLRARMGLWLLLLLDEPKTHCPSFECPTELGCSVTRERYTGCPHCQCGHINSATVSDDRERRKPSVVGGHSCPPIRSCPEEYGCHVRQRVGKCPFCKCGFMKQVPRPTGNRRT